MRPRLKVLHVITGLAAGGAESQLLRVVRASRHDCAVVSMYNPGVVAEQLRTEGFTVHDLAVPGSSDPRALRRLLAVLRTERPDVLHTHLYRAGLFGRLAGRLARTPVVVSTEHSLSDPDRLEGRAATPAVREMLRRSSRWAHATVAVSEQVRDNLAAWGVLDRPGHRVRLVRNGVDTDELRFDVHARQAVRDHLGVGPDVRLAGAVSRLHPDKRVDAALDGLAPRLGPHLRFVVVGDGAERGRLQRRAAQLGIGPYVHFTGEVRDVAPWLSALDVLVSASASETFGLGVLEALASGLPVVYVHAPVLDELPAPPASAVRAGPSPAQLAAAVQRVLAAPVPPAERTAPDLVARFDVRSTAAALDDLYDEIHRETHPRTRPHTRSQTRRAPRQETPA
ncbi:glycosyltransferase [Kineococcus sp. SYSU DK001]|uniref:glycosyltransferase n=1 Tax=Kineococcus sp. SYSU DK001 TaxID=3383122 RepID=UPI003D7DAEE0